MLATFGIKYIVHEKFKSSLVQNQIHFSELNTTPTMLNAILWCAIAYDDSTLYTAEYSLLKRDEAIKWIPFKRNLSYLNTYDSKSLETITWFSDGNYFIEPINSDTIAFYNVKWGRMQFDSTEPEKAFFFYWKFYIEDHEIKYKEVRNDDWKIEEAFSMLMKRIGI
jgi:inner membrane protein